MKQRLGKVAANQSPAIKFSAHSANKVLRVLAPARSTVPVELRSSVRRASAHFALPSSVRALPSLSSSSFGSAGRLALVHFSDCQSDVSVQQKEVDVDLFKGLAPSNRMVLKIILLGLKFATDRLIVLVFFTNSLKCRC